jgi:signal transduction histidine kinase
MSRLPIRVRLTLAFTLAMAMVLAATGAFLYLRLSSSLDEAIDEGLQSRAAELATRIETGDAGLGLSAATDPDERFVQVLASGGEIVDATPGLEQGPLLPGPDALSRLAAGETLRYELGDTPTAAGGARLLAVPVETTRGTRIVVVGAALEDRDETIRGFLTELLVVGPAALVLTALLGYALATAALRPVEAMRVEAEAISGSEPERRLPLPDSNDEVRRLGETLNEMLDRLQAALERERGFVADAGHELRTPLAVVKAELELALRRPRSASELEAAVRSAAAETDRLAQLADDLLLLARSDERLLDVRRETIQATGLLDAVAERFTPRAEAAGRRLQVTASEQLELPGNRRRLERALGNLVENGLAHGDGPVALSACDRNGRIELHVTDEGHGFPPAFLPLAFERFSRADEARTSGGTGLGLAIADAIARAHGGSAHAANREARGADVWLSLPRS